MSLQRIVSNYLHCDGMDAALQYLMDHPILLSERLFPDLIEAASEASDQVQHMLGFAVQVGKKMREEGGFPSGEGPLEKLEAQIDQGKLTEDGAIDIIRDRGIGDALALFYTAPLGGRLEIEAQNGDLTRAPRLMRLLLAAVDNRTVPYETDQIGAEAALSWIEIATRILGVLPDGRVLADAVGRGEAKLVRAEQSDDKELAQRLNHALGVLYLDPFTETRDTANFELQDRTWRASVQGQLSRYDQTNPDMAVPPTLEALKSAERHLRAAVQLANDLANRRDKGLALKALAYCLFWTEIFGGTKRRDETVAFAQEAHAIFSDTRYQVLLPSIDNLLKWYGAPRPSEAETLIAALLDDDVANPLDGYAPAVAIEMLGQATMLCLDAKKYEDALTLNWRLIGLAVETAPPRIQTKHAEGFLRLAAQIATDHVDTLSKWMEGLPMGDIADLIHEVGTGDAPPPGGLWCLLIGVAGVAASFDCEADALILLDEAAWLEPAPKREEELVLRTAMSFLRRGAGSNAFMQGDGVGAIDHYIEGLKVDLLLGDNERVTDGLRRISSLARGNLLEHLAGALASVSAQISTERGIGTVQMLRRLWRKLLAEALCTKSLSPDLLLTVLQAGRAASFAQSWAAGSIFNPQSDVRMRRQLDQLADFASDPEVITEQDRQSESGLMSPENVLCAPTDSVRKFGGGSAVDQFEMLRRDFDRTLQARLVPPSSEQLSPLDLDEIRAAMDSRSVVLTHVDVPLSDGGSGLLLILITKEGKPHVRICNLNAPSLIVFLTDADQEVALDPLGLLVSRWREVIQDAPMFDTLSEAGVHALSTARDVFLGGGLEQVLAQEHSKGRDHLIVVPTGAANFFPFHLLGDQDNPLSDDWSVTVLPHLSMLRPRTDNHSPRNGTCCLGLQFADGQPHNQSPLPEVPNELRAVSDAMNGAERLDEDATETALFDALKTAQVVHIASHGRHAVNAPAFQSLFLWPDAQSDGVLEAWELTGTRLDGLEIIGLSGCETALGRFDLSDNPQGLTATLLGAGASTVVGTLWDVRSSAAEVFFSAFYSALASGAERRDAFATALRDTRTRHPNYRDWGAFYMAGDWRAI